jgi:hypothetical protein
MVLLGIFTSGIVGLAYATVGNIMDIVTYGNTCGLLIG